VQHPFSGLQFWRGLILSVALITGLSAAEDSRDPEFEKVPFAEWLSGAPQTPLRWAERVLPVVLSVHQRLLARVQIQLDGAEAAKRRGEGELVFFFQLTDATGRVYQDHTIYDLEKVEEGLKSQDLICTESAFVLPGDYTVALAIYDTATKEHAVKKDKLHVAPLKTDPLPDAWRNLPAVEFEEAIEPPDRWFVPNERGRLHLPLAPHRPLHLEVVVNLTPSEASTRRFGVQDRNFSFLFPVLKVLSQMKGPNVSLNVSLLDLSRRSVVYQQDDVDKLDWEKMKSSLTKANSGSIDVKSLADRQHSAAFFMKEVASRVSADPARVVIVLSPPMVFDAEQDLSGVELKAAPDNRLFYLRLQSPATMLPVITPDSRRRRGLGGYPGRARTREEAEIPATLQSDQLEPMLKGMAPHLMDVLTADQFRKALATLMGEISSL
jgi:hypothetical protein